MKKQLLLASLMLAAGTFVSAQQSRTKTPVSLGDAARPAASSRTMTCTADTLRYAIAKEYAFNPTAGTNGFFLYPLFPGEMESQAFISPGTVNVVGVNFRARSNSGTPTAARVYLYSVDAAFQPVAKIDSATITVSTIGIYNANFAAPVTVTGNYAVVLKAQGLRLDFVANDRATGAGGEALGYNFWDAGTGSTWYANNDGTNGWGQDIDSDINPIVTYQIATDFTVTPSASVCLGTAQTFTNTTSPLGVLGSRMYNYNVFLDYFGGAAIADSTFGWDMGNATAPMWSMNAAYTYPAAGVYTTTLYTFAGFWNSCLDTKASTVTVSAIPVLSITNPASACGSVDLTASGITAGSTNATSLTYWTDAAATMQLASPSAVTMSGTYYIQAMNGPCSDIEAVTVTVTPNDDATITGPSTLCATASAVTLTAPTAGGMWTGSGVDAAGLFDPATAGIGTHTISYTTSGVCPDTDVLSIAVTAADDVTISGPTAFCEGTSAVTLTAPTAGGTWSGTGVSASGSFDPATAGLGTHVITYATSGACANSDTHTIDVNANDDATIAATTPVCEGAASFSLTAVTTGGTWSGIGVNPSGTFDVAVAGPGSHTITYTTAGVCPDMDTEVVVVNATEDATITGPAMLCDDAAPVTLMAATSGGTWTGTGVDAAGSFNPAVATAGTHVITYTTAGTCAGTDNISILVSVCTGINENSNGSVVTVYPNPSTGAFTVNIGENIPSTIEVYNVIGSRVAAKQFNTVTANFDLSNLNAGLYFVKVITEKGQITKQITVTK